MYLSGKNFGATLITNSFTSVTFTHKMIEFNLLDVSTITITGNTISSNVGGYFGSTIYDLAADIILID